MKKYYVDVPTAFGNEEWILVGEFDTREAALDFVKEKYGADDDGKIELISEIDTGADGLEGE